LKKNKNTIVSIHQPNFLPWIGFFYKISRSNVFVFLDNVQFSKGSIINRVKIKTNSGEKWITVPVKTKGKLLQKINEVQIKDNPDWRRKILGNLISNYSKSKFFNLYFPTLKEILLRNYIYLKDINIELIKWIIDLLDFEVEILSSSDLIDGMLDPTERLISICKKVNADIYLSGFGGRNYQISEQFKRENIELKVYDFVHPVYKQQNGDFLQGLSIIDFIFNVRMEIIKEFFHGI